MPSAIFTIPSVVPPPPVVVSVGVPLQIQVLYGGPMIQALVTGQPQVQVGLLYGGAQIAFQVTAQPLSVLP